MMSIRLAKITDQSGSLVSIHGAIAEREAIRAIVSDFVIFFSPYLRASPAVNMQKNAVTPIVHAPGPAFS